MSNWSLSQSIRANLEDFWKAAAAMGLKKEELLNVSNGRSSFSGPILEQLKKYVRETGVSLQELICYNQYADLLMPEDCTVYFAAGNASKSGMTVFGKNSDKSGNRAFNSDVYYKNRQISVVAYYNNPDGSHIVGVAAAGSTGLKMGLNSYGVAVGTNYGQTKAAEKMALDPIQKLAGDRAQIAREALTEKTALDAARKAVSHVMEHPMASSGILEFADAKEVYVVESAYDYVAIKRVRDAVDSRANFFNILPQLNREGNISSFCRYYRSQELLKANEGAVTADILRAISMDHENGPGGNSICRHSYTLDSATLGAAVMELNADHPEQSVIQIALGTPCTAWTSPEGHISISMNMPEEEIPIGFRNGDVFRRFCLNEPLV